MLSLKRLDTGKIFSEVVGRDESVLLGDPADGLVRVPVVPLDLLSSEQLVLLKRF